MSQEKYRITKDMIVNEVINKYPQTDVVLTRYGVDLCCGGVQSIEKTAIACNVKNIDELMDALNKAIPEETGMVEEEVKDESKEIPSVAESEGSELKEITGKTTVKEIIKNYPQTKGVFSKYGLLECGGEYGPEEAVYFFARVHNVDGDSLIKELNDVVQGKAEAPEVSEDDTATAYENIHEKFMKTAIVIALSTGCVYGAILLFYMGLQHSLYSVSRVLIETHGHTQIFGWCGLFIMGVSYFVLPRFYATRLYSGKLANLSFVFMVSGILLVFLFRSLLPFSDSSFFKTLIISGCLLEVAAVLIFLVVVFKTILSAEKQELEPYEGFIISGYLWFLVQIVALTGITVYMINTGKTSMPHVLVGPLRHIQIMGFITFVIFGVLTRTLPVFLGLKAPNPKINLLIMLILNFSVLLRAASEPLKAYFIDINLTTYYALNTLFFTSGCLEFISVLLFLYNLNLLKKPEIDYSGMEIEKGYERFVWAAFMWLIVAEIAMLIFTFYEASTGTPASHALIGAYRHAVTVGFITMMIFGYASRIVPISQGVKLHSYSLLTKTFILINVGSAIRVIFQPVAVHTGSTPAFLLMGISGFIESLAILLFGINIWKTFSAGKLGAEDDAAQEEITTVTASTNVYQLIKQHPQAMDVLVSKGFTQLKNPVLRNTLARAVNIAQATKIRPTDLDQLLKELNESLMVGKK
ncbi:MAG: hypothetical protein SCARUB_00232 [Candidatus Scalindua rubra]|uniref:DUF1858 domain-containing protein n=1 Tax=Candidatus Scalindua rubra TaxID=1872076 RepID=A0A1E3XGB6_9BACT|nr:MAG: hypothetical protein SCARUB_00232 [Candidatus Scalindua rubra]